MTHPHIQAVRGRERQKTPLAGAEAARTAWQARLHRRQVRRWPGDLAGLAGVVPTASTAASAASAHRAAGASMSAGMYSAMGLLSFGRIIDIPFDSCVLALGSWRRAEENGKLHIGQSLLRWPIEYDRDCSPWKVEVALARGPLRPPLRMRLEIDRWSTSSRTALELIPCQRVRPTATYFRSGHLLLDSLAHSLRQHLPAQHLDRIQAAPPTCQVPATNPPPRTVL